MQAQGQRETAPGAPDKILAQQVGRMADRNNPPPVKYTPTPGVNIGPKENVNFERAPGKNRPLVTPVKNKTAPAGTTVPAAGTDLTPLLQRSVDAAKGKKLLEPATSKPLTTGWITTKGDFLAGEYH